MGSTLQGGADGVSDKTGEENKNSLFASAIAVEAEGAGGKRGRTDANTAGDTDGSENKHEGSEKGDSGKADLGSDGQAGGAPEEDKAETDEGDSKEVDGGGEKAGEGDGGDGDGEQKLSSRANDRIRKAIEERNEERRRREALEAEVSAIKAQLAGTSGAGGTGEKPKTDAELSETTNPETGEFYTASEIKMMRLEERLDRERTEREQASATAAYQANALRVGKVASEAIAKHPWLDENSEEFDQERSAKVQGMMMRGFMRTDESGNITHVSNDIEAGMAEIIEAYAPKKIEVPKATIKADPSGVGTKRSTTAPDKSGFAAAITVKK